MVRVNLADLANEEGYEPDGSTTTPGAADLSNAVLPSRVAPVAQLALNPLNKRPPGVDDEIEQMAATFRSCGVIQPLVVCSTHAYLTRFPAQADALSDTAQWVVLIGNRRLQAARAAPLDEVPIIVHDEQAASMYEVMLVENVHRRALPPAEEAEAMAAILHEDEISQRELARRIGKSHPYVHQRLALLNLVPELRAALDQGELTVELARQFGELSMEQQEAIVAAGKPYRRLGGNAVSTRAPRPRSIRITSPATAAESIRQKFSRDELTELIRLLTRTSEAIVPESE